MILYLAFSVLGCYAKLERRRLASAAGLLSLLGTVLFLLGLVLRALTK